MEEDNFTTKNVGLYVNLLNLMLSLVYCKIVQVRIIAFELLTG